MEIEKLDLDRIIKDNEGKSLKSTLQKLAEEGAEEVTIAVHSAFDLEESEVPIAKKESYLKSTRAFLDYCDNKGIPIIHFRDMLPIFSSNVEPSILSKFGVEADYEILTFPNTGIPLELMPQYLEQKLIYNIFSPNFYLGENHKIKIVNGIGCYSEPDSCLIDGVAVMDRIAQKEVRLIQEGVLPKTLNQFDINTAYSRRYGLSREKLKLYSFNHGKMPTSIT